LLGAQLGLAEVAEVRHAQPVVCEQKIVFDPRIVPATSSCSEAIPMTSPSGDSKVPRIERMTCGEPPIGLDHHCDRRARASEQQFV